MKYKSPLNGNELWISQTYHITGGNKAIDFGNTPVGTPVYAMANGTIGTISTSLGSYLTLNVENSKHILFYVHIYNFKVSQGQKVTQGQLLAEVAPKSVNGGYNPHLHIGLQPEYDLMDYMDRGIVFRTKYQEIKDIWFTGENLNWSLFKDLSYNDNVMEYKAGDIIIFTGEQNIRKGSGTKYDVTGTTHVGMIATIEGVPRVADGYTWYDLVGYDWIADVGKFRLATSEEINPPKPPQEPTTPPALVECQNKVKDLESDIVAKNKQISTLTKNLEKSKEKVVKLEGELKLEKDKIRVEQERVAHLEGVLKGEREEANEIAIKMEKMIEEYKKLEQEKLDLKEQLSKGSLAKASTGEIFAELWNRIVRSIK